MTKTHNISIDTVMLEALEKLKKADHIWISLSGNVIYYGDGKNVIEDSVNVISFHNEDETHRFVKALNLDLDDPLEVE